MKSWFKLIAVGWILNTSYQILFQDIMGKERFLKYIDNMWVSGYVTVTAAIVMLICCYSVVMSVIGKEKIK